MFLYWVHTFFLFQVASNCRCMSRRWVSLVCFRRERTWCSCKLLLIILYCIIMKRLYHTITNQCYYNFDYIIKNNWYITCLLQTHYHVVFLDDVVSRSWLTKKNIQAFPSDGKAPRMVKKNKAKVIYVT